MRLMLKISSFKLVLRANRHLVWLLVLLLHR